MPRPQINNQTLEKILEAHELRMSLHEAARHASTSATTVKRYWDKKDLEPHNERRQVLTDKQKKKMLEAHTLNMSLNEAAAYTKTSRETVRSHWNAAGIRQIHETPLPLTQSQIAKIYEAHESGMTTYEAAEHADTCQATIVKYWKEAGLKPHNERPLLLTEEQKKRIYAAHELRMTVTKAAKYATTSHTTVRRYWNEAGLKPHYSRHKRR